MGILNSYAVRGDCRIRDDVHLGATHLGKEALSSKSPDISGFSNICLGIDPADTPIPVLPTAHYSMGRIPTDVQLDLIVDQSDFFRKYRSVRPFLINDEPVVEKRTYTVTGRAPAIRRYETRDPPEYLTKRLY